jgi:hypothetical protein
MQVNCPACGTVNHLPSDFNGGDVMCSNCDARFTVEPPRPDPDDLLAASVTLISKWFFLSLGASLLVYAVFLCWHWPPLLWIGALPLAAFHVGLVIHVAAYLRTIAYK